jgi:tetratricopeptide (TPR) repeat protein
MASCFLTRRAQLLTLEGMTKARIPGLKMLGILCVLALLAATNSYSQDSVASTAATTPPATNPESNDALRAYLQIQEQMHATQLAVERNRQEAEAAAAQNVLTLSNHLAAIEQSLLVQRASEAADAQHTNRVLLAIIGFFAIVGFATALCTAYFQWRAVSRLADISAALPIARGLPALTTGAALGLGEHEALSNTAVEQSNARLLGFIEHLEKRLAELEHTTSTSLPEIPSTGNGDVSHTPEPTVAFADGEKPARIPALLEHGQSLLNGDRSEEAVACFDEILAIDANHAEALVKKGAALEKLRRPQEAIECYDRAIAADNTMTIAYLHKGGLCNRLERYSEAMECYERALHTQEKERAA